MRVALDVMGGDRAPRAIVLGALLAVDSGLLRPEELLLVGSPERIVAELAEAGRPADLFPIQAASQVVEMNESPSEALRKKRDSSIFVAAQAVREKRADALVSAGHTGAAVASSVLLWKTLPGVRRPGIAVSFASAGGGTVTIIDVGANVSCTPEDLLHYGLMADALAREALGVPRPKVGLMNIGAEDEKGNQLTKRTHTLFRESGLNFLGNVEGKDVFHGVCDVIVCEGFVGNVILKLGEGLSDHLLKAFAAELGESGIAEELRRHILAKVSKATDYSEYGGALLLGVDGICVICHGHSDPKAIANALRLAATAVARGINQQISAAILERGSKQGEQGFPARN